MATIRTFARVVSGIGVVILLLCGCGAAPPRTPPGPGGPMDMAPVPVMIEAIIVDTRPTARALTVKDVREHATWMVSLPENLRIFGPGRPEMKPEELEIDDRVRISGTSRIELILKADEIELLTEPRRP